jgi:aspartyl-tRNA(Asn)/glutamyl-tRNA(Gln) amidotransferase subunit A
VKTSCGSKMLDNFIAPYDATVIEKFNRSGTVMLGKTNLDEFAMGSSNENSFYGSVGNPWDTSRVPGGSSGGSAAAVAARLAPGATGTDTGGSIRQPAALCGITGIKPTYGRVSRYGIVAFGSSLEQAGPFAHTAEDCALLLQSMSGFDPRDSTSVDQAVPNFSVDLNKDIAGLKIGLPKEFFADGLDSDVATVIETAISEFHKLGAEIVDISLPNMGLSIPVYYVVAPAECSSNLSRMDGVRFGHQCENPIDLEDLYKRSRSEGFGEEVKRRIMIGTYALSAGYYDAYYLKAQRLRRLIKQDYVKAFEQVDVILCPTTPEVAFKRGEKTDDPINMYLQDIYTLSLNLAGLPGMSIPAGFSQSMPVGLQLIGNYFEESRILNTAHKFQQVTDWHLKAPEVK